MAKEDYFGKDLQSVISSRLGDWIWRHLK